MARTSAWQAWLEGTQNKHTLNIKHLSSRTTLTNIVFTLARKRNSIVYTTGIIN